jgi:ubiquinone/menaquinone biosynthesis C-methylase UbiE
MNTTTHDHVREYYGRVLQSQHDLKTTACCTTNALAPHVKAVARKIEGEIFERFYGCGSPIPDAIEGATILDLGCGTGRDVYLCAGLAGERGTVIGLDMTREQLDVAERHADRQRQNFGYARSNVRFVHGYLEDLAAAAIEDESIDVVISNCVLNLSPAKERVFAEILRVLKPGGELHFSDIFADRRLDPALMEDPVLVGECLAGAMYTEDFRRMMARLGVPDIRTTTSRPVTIDDPAIRAKLGAARFRSVTVRAFKLADLEDRCEDYGQSVIYRGTMPHHPSCFSLDDGHTFEAHRPERVCGNTAAMVSGTRLGRHFDLVGDRTSRHFGLFPCGGGGTAPAGDPDAADDGRDRAGGGRAGCC